MKVYLLWRDHVREPHTAGLGVVLVGIYRTHELADREYAKKCKQLAMEQWAELKPLGNHEVNPFWIEEHEVEQ